MAPASERKSRSEKMPEELALIMTTKANRDKWFKTWVEHNESWNKVIEALAIPPTSSLQGSKTWLTLKELQHHYKDDDVAQNIAQSKKLRKEVRPHPIYCLDPMMTQYKVSLNNPALPER